MPDTIIVISVVLIIALILFLLKRKQRKKEAVDQQIFDKRLNKEREKWDKKPFTFVTSRNAIQLFRTGKPQRYKHQKDVELLHQDKLFTALTGARCFEDYQTVFKGFDRDQDLSLWEGVAVKDPVVVTKLADTVGDELAKLVGIKTSIPNAETKKLYYQRALEISNFVKLGLFDKVTEKKLGDSASSLARAFKKGSRTETG